MCSSIYFGHQLLEGAASSEGGGASSNPTAAPVDRDIVVVGAGAGLLGQLVLLEGLGVVADGQAHAGRGEGEEDEAGVTGPGGGGLSSARGTERAMEETSSREGTGCGTASCCVIHGLFGYLFSF